MECPSGRGDAGKSYDRGKQIHSCHKRIRYHARWDSSRPADKKRHVNPAFPQRPLVA